MKAKIIDKKIERQIGELKEEISYPQVELDNKLLEYKINYEINDTVEDLVKMQRKEFEDLEYMRSNYNVGLNEKSLLSIVFDNYVYWKGAMHGLTVLDSLTVDLESGKRYNFDDLFDLNTNYRQKLDSIIKEKIKEENIYLIRNFEEINKNQSFYLEENNLVIYYQLYEYTPYAYGFLKFFIPYEDIKDIIDKEGPIARLI